MSSESVADFTDTTSFLFLVKSQPGIQYHSNNLNNLNLISVCLLSITIRLVVHSSTVINSAPYTLSVLIVITVD